jgi:hypothetical protein
MPSFAFPNTLKVSLSLPLRTPHPKSQPIFAFEEPTRKSGQVTWTFLPQGFRDSPHLFGLALTQDLAEWQYPQATLLQYVDDLLLCEPNEPAIS